MKKNDNDIGLHLPLARTFVPTIYQSVCSNLINFTKLIKVLVYLPILVKISKKIILF